MMRSMFLLTVIVSLSLFADFGRDYTIKLEDDNTNRGYWKMIGVLGAWDIREPKLQSLTDNQIDSDIDGTIGIKENGGIAKDSSHTPQNLVKVTALGDIKSVTIFDINTTDKFLSTNSGNLYNNSPQLLGVIKSKKVQDPLSDSSNSYFLVEFESAIENLEFKYYTESFDGNRSEIYTLNFTDSGNQVPVDGVLSTSEPLINYTLDKLDVKSSFDLDISTSTVESLDENSGELLLYSYDPDGINGKFWPVYNSRNKNLDSNDFNQIEAGRGYWAKFDSNNPDVESGFRLNSTAIEKDSSLYGDIIKDGWNILSLPELKAIDTVSTAVIPFTTRNGEYSVLKIIDEQYRDIGVDINSSASVSEVVNDINFALQYRDFNIFAMELDNSILLFSESQFSVFESEPAVTFIDDGSNLLKTDGYWRVEVENLYSYNSIFNIDISYRGDTVTVSTAGDSDRAEFFQAVKSKIESIDYNGSDLIVDENSTTPLLSVDYDLYLNRLLLKEVDSNDPNAITFPKTGIDITHLKTFTLDSLGTFTSISGDSLNSGSSDLQNYTYLLEPNAEFLFNSDLNQFTIDIGEDNNLTVEEINTSDVTVTINGSGISYKKGIDSRGRGFLFVSAKEPLPIENSYFVSYYNYTVDPIYSNSVTIKDSGDSETISIPASTTLTALISQLNSLNLDSTFIELPNGIFASLSKDRFFVMEQDLSENFQNEVRPVELFSVIIDKDIVSQHNFFKGYLTLNSAVSKLERVADGKINLPELNLFSNNRIEFNLIPIENNLLLYLQGLNSNYIPTEIITTSTDIENNSINWHRVPLEKPLLSWATDSLGYKMIYRTYLHKGYWVKFREKNSDDSQNSLTISDAFFNREVINVSSRTSSTNLIRGKVVVLVENLEKYKNIAGHIEIGKSVIPLNLQTEFDLFETYIDYRDLYQNEDITSISEITVKLYTSGGEVTTTSIPIGFKKLSKPTFAISYMSGTEFDLSLSSTSVDSSLLYSIYSNGAYTQNLITKESGSDVLNFSFDSFAKDLSFRVNYLDIVALDSADETVANYSEVLTLKYVPLYYNTSMLSDNSSSDSEDYIPDRFDSSGTISESTTNDGVALNSYLSSRVNLFYQPIDLEQSQVGNPEYGMTDFMYISFDGTTRVARVKFDPKYRGDRFFIYDEGSSKLYEGSFEHEIYQFDGNPMKLVVVE